MPFEVNVPVSVGEVTVVPGDYIYADDSGAAIIPASVLQPVLEEAIKIEEADSESIETIGREDPEQVIQNGGSEEIY
jgi:regulator of RNase E activity RraA